MSARTSRLTIALLLVVLVAPAAQAAFNPTHDYDATIGFADGFDQGITLISGQGTVEARGHDEGIGILGTPGFTIHGVQRACWGEPLHCEEGDLSLEVLPGSAVGLYAPGPLVARLDAQHMLATFQDLSGRDAAGLELGPVLLATTVDGNLTLDLPPVATDLVLDEAAAIVALDARSSFQLTRAGATLAQIDTAHEPLYYTGHAAVAPVQADAFVLPFSAGSQAQLAPAGHAAAERGLDIEQVLVAWHRLAGERPEAAPDLSAFAGMLDGAIVSMPPEGRSEEFLLVRYDHLDLTGGAEVQAVASGPLVMEDGRVRGAGSLVGVGYVALPLWSILLWCLGIGLLVARTTTGAPKTHERWDAHRWVGRVLGVLALLVVAWLWDRELAAVVGVSVLSGGGDVPLVMLLLVQFGFLGLILFATAAPLRLILTNASMLARQGSFMGLAAPVATLAGFVLGVTLLPSYLEHVLTRILEQVA